MPRVGSRGRLRRNQVKMYMDGLLSTRTALVLNRYKSDSPELDIGDKGIRYFQQKRLIKYLNSLQVGLPLSAKHYRTL